MAKEIDVDHPAVGAAHLFVPGAADSLVAAALLTARVPWSTWVMIAREHRLPLLMERPLAETARQLWCLGYSGTGHQLLPAALEAHVSHRPVYWLSTTSGRIALAAQELPGLHFESMPGGSLVPLVHRHLAGDWLETDYAYERLGLVLGRYPGAKPTPAELSLVNQLHAASVAVRNNEHLGALLVRSLAEEPPVRWPGLELLLQLGDEGEQLIRSSRKVLQDESPFRGEGQGAALWVVDSGRIARGAHGKSVAAQAYYRQAPAALVERVERGFTKAWVVLPRPNQRMWHQVMTTFANFGNDFSHTGLRGAGALASDSIEEFSQRLWDDLSTDP
jgi:hypothetical protein